MGVRAQQVEKGRRGAFRGAALQGSVHGDDRRHLQVPVALVRVVEPTEGTDTRGFAADQHTVERQLVT